MAGATVAEARTVAVNVFVLVELFYLFNCRSLTQPMFCLGFFSNPLLFGRVATKLVLQAMFTYLPGMNLMFHSAPLGPGAWGRILAVSLITSIVVGVEKWFRRKSIERWMIRHA